MPKGDNAAVLEPFNQIFKFLADSGGYALIVGLQIILPFILAITFLRWYMKDRSKRVDAREVMERELSQQRELQLRTDFDEQLRRERITQDLILRMNDRYDATLNRVTEAFGENIAVIRQAKEEIRRNADALNLCTSVLNKFTPPLPKRRSPPKPASVAVQAAEKTVIAAQNTVAAVEAVEAIEAKKEESHE